MSHSKELQELLTAASAMCGTPCKNQASINATIARVEKSGGTYKGPRECTQAERAALSAARDLHHGFVTDEINRNCP